MKRFLSLLTLFFFLHGFSLANANFELCKWLGDNYITYDNCVRTLEADPSSRTADNHGLSVIIVNLTIANATKIQSKFEVLLKNNSDPTTTSLLEGCLNLYSGGIPSLRSAADDAASKNYGGAAELVFNFLSVPGTCDQDYHAKKGVMSPLVHENNELVDLIMVARAINLYMSRHG